MLNDVAPWHTAETVPVVMVGRGLTVTFCVSVYTLHVPFLRLSVTVFAPVVLQATEGVAEVLVAGVAFAPKFQLYAGAVPAPLTEKAMAPLIQALVALLIAGFVVESVTSSIIIPNVMNPLVASLRVTLTRLTVLAGVNVIVGMADMANGPFDRAKLASLYVSTNTFEALNP